MGKYFILTFWIFFITSITFCFENKTTVQAKEKELIIVLDPGHGGSQSGAARENETIEEKDLNLKIARYLKKELQSYEKIKVYLTRTDDKDMELQDRIQFAVSKKADVLISLHNNAAGDCAAYDHGCTVLAAKTGYKNNLALEGQKLSCNILNELVTLGITNQGILLRDSEANERYPNRVLADYYAIIRGGVENNMLSVLVEHAFIDSNSDYKKYLSSDKKLKQLAHADATGIARYYQLVKKRPTDSSNIKECELEPLTDYKEKLVHAVDGNARNNKISYKVYYSKSEESDNCNLETFQAITRSVNEKGMTDFRGLSELKLGSLNLKSSVHNIMTNRENTRNSSGEQRIKNDKKKEGSNVKILIAICNILLLCCIVAAVKINKRNQVKVRKIS